MNVYSLIQSIYRNYLHFIVSRDHDIINCKILIIKSDIYDLLHKSPAKRKYKHWTAAIIEKQPSSDVVKRNVEKYAVTTAVSQGRLFPVHFVDNSRSVGDRCDSKENKAVV